MLTSMLTSPERGSCLPSCTLCSTSDRFLVLCSPCSGALDWYHALPPITRALLTAYLATGLAAWAGVLPLKYLYHDWRLEFKRVPEVRIAAERK